MNQTEIERIIEPVDRRLLNSELSRDKFVRKFRELEIYVVDAQNSPAVMNEIGRVREVEFRLEGGGTGKAKDVDRYDTEGGFRQLVVWDPVATEIVSMYRFIGCGEALRDGEADLPTARLFDFSNTFVAEYLPTTIELGRSVVNRSSRKKLHGLFAVWSGLGAMVAELPEIEYLFGKVTSYADTDSRARNALLYYMNLHFKDSGKLIEPRPELEVEVNGDDVHGLFTGADAKANYKILSEYLSSIKAMVPPLFISYMDLSSTLCVFGTARNPHFGDVMETAMMVTIKDIYQKHRDRFIGNYESVNPRLFRWD